MPFFRQASMNKNSLVGHTVLKQHHQLGGHTECTDIRLKYVVLIHRNYLY